MDKYCNARERVIDLDKIPTNMDTDKMCGILLTSGQFWVQLFYSAKYGSVKWSIWIIFVRNT